MIGPGACGTLIMSKTMCSCVYSTVTDCNQEGHQYLSAEIPEHPYYQTLTFAKFLGKSTSTPFMMAKW
jgi:hypothetical protein